MGDSMSSISILGDTSGSVLIQAPAVAGSSTLTLPTTGGTIRTTTTPGTILQVVSTTKTDTFSSSTTGSWVSVTGLTASITPTSTTSKVMIMMDFALAASTSVNIIQYRLTKNGSAVGVGDARGSRNRVSGAAGTISSNAPNSNYSKTASYLDSPASTSALTYGVDVFNTSGSFYVNRNGEDGDSTSYYTGTSTITLWEIAG